MVLSFGMLAHTGECHLLNNFTHKPWFTEHNNPPLDKPNLFNVSPWKQRGVVDKYLNRKLGIDWLVGWLVVWLLSVGCWVTSAIVVLQWNLSVEQIKSLSALTVLPCTKNCKIVQFIEFQKHSFGFSLRPINNKFFNIINHHHHQYHCIDDDKNAPGIMKTRPIAIKNMKNHL